MKKNKSLEENSLLKLLQEIDESQYSHKESSISKLKIDNFFKTTRVNAPIIEIKNKIGTSSTAFPKIKGLILAKNNEAINEDVIEEQKRQESKESVEILFSKESTLTDYVIIPEENKNLKLKDKCFQLVSSDKLKYALSGVTGVGTGLAMMPIFNYELTHLEEFGINIHANKSLLAISTINTLLVNSTDSAISIYRELKHSSKDNLTTKQKTILKTAVAASVIPALLQISQLWDVELHDREVSESTGFDEYIAWATFTTIPLLITQTLKSFENIRSFAKGTLPSVELDTIGSKTLVYSTTSLSAFGRAIAYTAAVKTLFENLGCEEDFSMGAGIVLGGILGASLNGFAEYQSLKSLFVKQTNELSKKEIALGSFCALEGSWFTLPVISEGLELTKDWNVFLQALIFFPTFLSRAVHESKSLHHTFDIKSNTEHNHDIQPSLPIEHNITDQDILLAGNYDIIE